MSNSASSSSSFDSFDSRHPKALAYIFIAPDLSEEIRYLSCDSSFTFASELSELLSFAQHLKSHRFISFNSDLPLRSCPDLLRIFSSSASLLKKRRSESSFIQRLSHQLDAHDEVTDIHTFSIIATLIIHM